MHRTDKRAETAALVGLVAQVFFFGLFLILFNMNGSPATLAEGWHLLAGAGVWILIFIELYQQRMAWQQREELHDLERRRLQQPGGSESVFSPLGADEELPAERRLQFIKKWCVPTFSILTAVVLMFLGVRLLPAAKPMTWITDALAQSVRNQFPTLTIAAIVSLVCFVLSRYCLGLSRHPSRRVLRAGANYIMGNALACFALVVVLALTAYGVTVPERIVAQVIPVVMILLAVEIFLNLILDLYRPRIPGGEHRPSYESRLLGLFSEPEGVLHSIAQTIDYQFGFKVSETWFYRLLQQAIVPLVLFGAASLYALSVIVIVQPGQQAIVTHFGQKPRAPLSQGLHFKWPWPIDKARVYDVDRVNQLILGFSGESAWADRTKSDPILWTVKHVTGSEFQLLVASKQVTAPSDEKAEATVTPEAPSITTGKRRAELSPVSILAGSLVIDYCVKDQPDEGLLDYVSSYANPQIILESVTYRQWTQYMASVDPMAVMTTDRDQTTTILARSIQEELDRRRSGLKIVRVALVGIHPPVDIAGAFESSINARQERETTVYKAQGDANERVPRATAVKTQILAQAEAQRYGKLILEKAKAQRFAAQLESYRIAPEVFFLRNYLDVLPSLGDVRKFILAVEHPEKAKIIVDDREKIASGILGLGEQAVKGAGQQP